MPMLMLPGAMGARPPPSGNQMPAGRSCPPRLACQPASQPASQPPAPPVLEEVDLDARHLRQFVVQRRKLAQHALGDRQRGLACGGSEVGQTRGWSCSPRNPRQPSQPGKSAGAGQAPPPARRRAPAATSAAPDGLTAASAAAQAAPAAASNELTALFMNVLSWAAWSLKTKAVGATMSTCVGGARQGGQAPALGGSQSAARPSLAADACACGGVQPGTAAVAASHAPRWWTA